MNPLVQAGGELEHRTRWGTWLFGALGAPPRVMHLDAKRVEWRNGSMHRLRAEAVREWMFFD